MMRVVFGLLGALAATTMVAPGCTTQQESPSARTDSVARGGATPELTDRRWTAITLRDRPILTGSRITMEATASSLGGYGGCNWYGGDYSLTGATLAVGPMTQSARACTQPEGTTEQESAYLQLLRQAVRHQRVGDTLRLFDRSGALLVVYHGSARLAMRPEDLENTRWTLADWSDARRITASRPTSGLGPPRLTLAFENGRMRGFAGCRNFTGSYRAEGDVIGFPTLSMVEMDCASPGMLELEGRFTTALSESSTYRLDKGRRLELYTPGGDTLVFTPTP